MSSNEAFAAKPCRTRYRWWLLALVAVAGLASWFLWPKSVMRQRYERIRIGMTLAEVTAIMGAEQSEAKSGKDLERWMDIVGEPSEGSFSYDHPGFWYDPERGVYIYVFCSHDNVVAKMMWTRMPPWAAKARERLYLSFYWLRGLVGW